MTPRKKAARDLPSRFYAPNATSGPFTIAPTLLAIATGAATPQRAKPRRLEHDMQVAFFKWVDAHPKFCDLPIYAVPNAGGYTGGFKANVVRVARMRAEGVRKGPPDINVDVPRGKYPGLRIELKRDEKTKPTADQLAWHAKLRAQGYMVAVCASLPAARDVLASYLGVK